MRVFWHVAVLALLGYCSPAFAQKVGAASRQQDLIFIANQLPVLNPNFFFQLDHAQFQQAVANLNAKLATATDAEFYTGLAQIVAMAGDAHTTLYLQGDYAFAIGFRPLPLSLIWLDDGVFVTAALQPYARAVGTELIAVGGMPIDLVVQQLATVISHENDEWVHFTSQQYLTAQQILQGLHIAPADLTTSMTFRNLAGDEFTLQIAPGSGELSTAPNAQTGPIAKYLRNPGLNYWFDYSPENRLLYFRYNLCEADPANPFAGFAANMLAAIDANLVDTFVWDFRGNTGGDSSIIQSLGLGLNSRLPNLRANPRFHVYLAIDKGTFSAALTNVMSFEQPLPNLSPILRVIGQATGGKPGYFGNVQGINLPGSKLLLQYSTVRTNLPSWIPDLPSLLPQIPVSVRSTDFFARHDPVLAAILAGTTALPAAPSGQVTTVNGASFRTDQGVAPGSFGSAFGTFSVVPDQVLVAGATASIVSAATSQVNFVVPVSVPTGPATVSVRAAGTELASGQVTISPSGPGLFILNSTDPAQPGAVENQDSSVNAAANPAPVGSVVQIFATGYGQLDSSGSSPVQVFFGDYPASVLFSGPLAQFPGLWQINAQVPAAVTGQVPLFVIAGGLASNASTIYVH